MYTRLTFWADFKPDSPAVPILKTLMEGDPVTDHPDHPYFDAPHAWAVLRCSSYYHRTGETQFVYDDIAKSWWLNIDSSLKNYDDEIELFLDWLWQHDSGGDGYRGFFIYEEDDHPTLIYRNEQGYLMRPIADPDVAL